MGADNLAQRVTAVLFGQFKPLVQLLIELAVANLLQNVRIPGFVNLECFPAVRADDFMHVYFFSFLTNICMSTSCGAPSVSAICQWSLTAYS